MKNKTRHHIRGWFNAWIDTFDALVAIFTLGFCHTWFSMKIRRKQIKGDMKRRQKKEIVI